MSAMSYRSGSCNSVRERLAVLVVWVAALLPLIAHAQPVMINEFMAANQTGIDDEDGDGSDWIELRNVSGATVNLAGWTLTDNAALPAKWTFPDVSLAANGYLVVFASEKNRAIPGRELHTNFKLSTSGEYLGLFPPGSTNVASQFAPAFPPQVTDVSYGLGIEGQSITLIAANAPCQVRVPVNGPLDPSWTAPDFVPTGWTNGQSGVGYELTSGGYAGMIRLQPPSMYGVTASCLLRFPFHLENPGAVSGLRLRLHYDDGFVMWLNGEQVASRNAPVTLAWNSTATASNPNANAIAGELFNLSDFQGDLRPGTNVLAIQGLNQSSGNFDFLILPVLEATTSTSATYRAMYFVEPTPGRANPVGATELGPILREVGHSPNVPAAGGDLFVTARVSAAFAPVGSVNLTYRVAFGGDVSAPMRDDGASGDSAAGDGVYGARIPASGLQAGQMVRYFVSAVDTGARTFRWPLYRDPLASPQYLGTVVRNPALTNPLPVFHWFALDTAAAETATGTRCSVFYLDEFYDNVFVRIRGASARGYAKKSFKFDFNPGNHCRFDPNEGRVEEINVNTTYTDKSFIRTQLAYETIEESGSPGCRAFNVRMQRNNAFFSVAIFSEQVDEDFLSRQGLDPEGALYKPGPPYGVFRSAAGTGAQASGWDKKTRLNESFADMQALEDGLRLTNITERTRFLFDHVNIPAQVNYMAANIIIQNIDRIASNFYAYRDSDGTGEWFMIPWDVDLTFGPVDLNTDTIAGNSDGPNNHLSHPLWGSKEFPYNVSVYNRFLDAIINTPVTREMFRRRLRSQMDQFLDPSEPYLDQRMNQLLAPLGPDVLLDHARWGGNSHFAWSGTTTYTPTQSVNRIKNEYLVQRRNHLFNTHVNGGALIPSVQPVAAQLRFATLEVTPISGNQDEEFIELRNDNAFAVDVSGWTLSGQVEHTFAPGTVLPGGTSLYLSPNVRAFRARATGPRGGQSLFVQGNYRGQLSARGGNLMLHDTAGRPTGAQTYAGTPSPAQQFLRITEIMYHPDAPDSPAIGSAYTADDFEFVELKNIGPAPLDLTGIRFTNGIFFNFTSAANPQLAPGATVLLVRNAAAFAARYGGGFNLGGQFVGQLDDAGENLRLEDSRGEVILDFAYNNTWYPLTDGAGFSLVIRDETGPDHAWGDKSAWRASGSPEGSPGASDPVPSALPPIVINEVLSHTVLPAVDAVELFNPTATDVNLGGWFLSDDIGTPKKFQVPANTILSAGGYVVFTEANFNAIPAQPTSFSFSSGGDEAYLFSADAAGTLTGYAHGFSFGPADVGVPFGRHLTSLGEERFVPQSALTQGSLNAGPKVGPVVISEIQYHPLDVGRFDNSIDEFIELRNISTTPVSLFDLSRPTNTWRVRGGVEFDFPTNVTLAAEQTVLLVNIDPTDAAAAGAFRLRHGLTPAVPLFGPYRGKLDNRRERITLAQPVTTLVGQRLFVVVDEVNYTDTAPWPTGADGSGASLQRKDVTRYGDDPFNWAVATPTPGAAWSPGTPPVITDQPSDRTIEPGTNLVLTLAAIGTAPLRYQWRFANTNILTATNATYSLSNAQPKHSGSYSATVINSGGIATATNFSVLVLQLPRITGQPTNQAVIAGTNVTISIQVSSSFPPTFQWRFNGTNLPGATGAMLSLTNVQASQAGAYSVVISNRAGVVTSGSATITVLVPPSFRYPPANQFALVSDTVVFTAEADGTGPIGYRWRRNGIIYSQSNPSSSLVLTNVQLAESGSRFECVVTNVLNRSGVISASAYLTVQADGDGDRLPDAWESAYGLNPGSAGDATLDLDRDGVSNQDEYLAGTNPADPLSYLKIDAIRGGQPTTLEFFAASNKTYTVQFKDSLNAAPWSKLAEIHSRSTNRVENVADAVPESALRVYRLATPAIP